MNGCQGPEPKRKHQTHDWGYASTNMDAESFREYLSSRLKEKAWSIRELARRANISHTWISNVLSGQTEPSWDFCAAIAKPLGLQPIEIFRLANLMPPLPEHTRTRRTLSEALDLLPPEDHEFLLRITRGLLSERGYRESARLNKSGAEEEDDMAKDQERKELLDALKDLPKEVVREIVDRAKELAEQLKQEPSKRPSEAHVNGDATQGLRPAS